MQAKDIPDLVVLDYLATQQGRWTMLFGTEFSTWVDGELVKAKVFGEAPPKVALAKMRALYRRGLVGGCDCGCRGDFEITDKGLALIGRPRTAEYSGY